MTPPRIRRVTYIVQGFAVAVMVSNFGVAILAAVFGEPWRVVLQGVLFFINLWVFSQQSRIRARLRALGQ